MKKIFFFFSLLTLVLCSLAFSGPLVTGLTPNHGSRDGANTVTITGSGFTGTTEVDFGVKILTPGEFTVVNDTTITVPSTPPVVPDVITVTVKVGANASPANHPYDEYVYQGDWFAYIPYFNGEGPYDVLVFDVPLETQITSIPAQNGGNDIGILPDGTYAYALNSGSNSLTIIDCSTNAAIPVNPNYVIPGASFPIAIAIRADGKQALTCNYSSGNVSILDLTNPTSPVLLTTLTTGPNPTSAIYTINGTTAYVTDAGANTLNQINLTTFTSTLITLPAGSTPSWMIMTPDGLTGYVASNTVLYPITNLNGTPIVQSPILGFDFSFPNFYPQLVINSDGTLLFATNTGEASVQPVTLANMTLGTLIPVGTTPNGISISPDGSFVYVDDGNDNTIAVINPIGPPAVVTEKTPTMTQNTPTDLAITPDQAPLAFFTATVLSDLKASFDASSSQSPTGTIANYAWDFGDGSPIVNTASPSITHKYRKPGTYLVTLEVTNTAGTSTFLTFTGQLVSRNGGPTAITSLSIKIPPIPIPPPPPSPPIPKSPTVKITQTINKYLTKTCYENLLTFKVPTGPDRPVLFRIYANAALTELLATVHAREPSIRFCSRHKHTTYYVVAVDASGKVSSKVKIKI